MNAEIERLEAEIGELTKRLGEARRRAGAEPVRDYELRGLDGDTVRKQRREKFLAMGRMPARTAG